MEDATGSEAVFPVGCRESTASLYLHLLAGSGFRQGPPPGKPGEDEKREDLSAASLITVTPRATRVPLSLPTGQMGPGKVQPKRGLNHRDTEDTEKTKTERREDAT